MEKSPHVLYINSVSKLFKGQKCAALDSITATLEQGKILGIVGPDGAGKTTLMRLLAGLLIPSQGTITVAGYDTYKDAEWIHEVTGYMPQKFGLYEDLTVIQNLNLYADLKGLTSEKRKTEFERLLSFTTLKPFVSRLARDLSGGMKQKLGLACALIKKPLLLLLDEPSVGVDPLSRRELWQMVYELLQEGISVIWTTSYLDEAEKCNDVILLNEGKVIYSGSPLELTQRVKGKVFKVTNIISKKRSLLEQILSQDNVLDGVIQGADIRVVLKNPKEPLMLQYFENSPLTIVPTPPRFEDAFMDILGKSVSGKSVLSGMKNSNGHKNEEVVVAQGLTKKFGHFTAANNITFSVKRGEIFGLLGPNGAGKSTTFKMLCGLLKPTSGMAYVMGLDLQKAPSEARQRIGYMAQKFSLYGDLSAQQNLDFFSGINGLTRDKQSEMIQKMISLFNLEPYLNTNSNVLPLGFKQRLALSCAIMHQPDVLFLDEPTSGVDPLTRREFWGHINTLVVNGGTAVVTTHFMDEAEYCDRIALVYQSQIIHMGTPDELKALAISKENPYPTLEDAFIKLIKEYGNHR